MDEKDDKSGAKNSDPVINSLIYALIFVCLLEYWLSTGVLT